MKVKKNKIFMILTAFCIIVLAVLIAVITTSSKRVVTKAEKLSDAGTLFARAEGNGKLVPIMRYVQKGISNASLQMFIVESGDRVEKGDVVAYLDSEYTDMYLSLLEQKGQAELSITAGNEDAKEIYNAIVKQIEALLSNKEACNSMFIYADVSGRICKFKVENGDEIKIGDELFEIDDDSVYLISFSLESWTKPLFYGDVIKLYAEDGKELSFDAKIVKPEKTAQGYEYTLYATECGSYYDQNDTVYFKLDFGSAKGHILSKEAVVYIDSEAYVYILDGKKAKLVPVTVLLSDKSKVCLDGLEKGQSVLLETSKLSDGVKVKVE